MNITTHEMQALKVVADDGDQKFEAISYLNINTKLQEILNATWVEFRNLRNVVHINYIAKGSNLTTKISCKKTLLKDC